MPGKPASFSVDSSKTVPAPIEVEIEVDGKLSNRKPSISQTGPGLHDVTYVPPPVGQPYQVRNFFLAALLHPSDLLQSVHV